MRNTVGSKFRELAASPPQSAGVSLPALRPQQLGFHIDGDTRTDGRITYISP